LKMSRSCICFKPPSSSTTQHSTSTKKRIIKVASAPCEEDAREVATLHTPPEPTPFAHLAGASVRARRPSARALFSGPVLQERSAGTHGGVGRRSRTAVVNR
jgi:hypothetical protein